MAPASVELTITAPIDGAGDYTFEVQATGAYYTYRRNAILHVLDVDPCIYDLNDDGIVGGDDFVIVWSQLGCQGICLADVSQDFMVDTADLILIMSLWGAYCE